MSLKNNFGERLKLLYVNDNNSQELDIKEDTFNKYIRGERFPKPDILEKIKNHYKVPYSYLFGEYDNKDLDTSEISGKLGLSNKSITKLANIRFEKNIQDRELMLYALNEIIENIDLLEFGKFLLLPNENNKNIKTENIYEYYSFFINHGQGIDDYEYVIKQINSKKNYSDYMLNKRLFELFEKVRNSKECATIFTNYIHNEIKQCTFEEEKLNEFIYSEEYNPHFTDEEIEESNKVLQEEYKQIEIRNQQIIDKRKEELGI